MKTILISLLLCIFFHQVYTRCFGVPMLVIGGRTFNCQSICCSNGFVQDLITGSSCVSCDSVGLTNCAKCGLYANSSTGQNSTYRCLQSSNIPNLVTKGSISSCASPDGHLNTHVLNNWTHYNQCSACNQVIPNSKKCYVDNLCTLTLADNTGNGCKPSVKVQECNEGYGIANIHQSLCQSCSDLIFGCQSCENRSICYRCDSSLNLTLSEWNNSCVCIQNTICNTCSGSYMFFDQVSLSCVCKDGYTLEQQKCIKVPQCTGQNEVYNPINSSCVCELSHSRNTDNVCELTECGNNQELSPTGLCICKNGYSLIDSSCILAGSYRAISYGYNLEISQDNFTIVNTQSTYKCGCPAGWKYINGSCTLCSTIGKNCPCSEGWTWYNQTCVTCDDVGLKNCFSCDQAINFEGDLAFQWCDRCQPGFQINTKSALLMSSCRSCGYNCSSCEDTIQKHYGQCYMCYPAAVLINQNSYCVDCNLFINKCIGCYNNIDHYPYDTHCITCQSPYIPSENKKSCVCPSPLTNGVCIPCHVGCIECNASVCLKCRPGMILDVTNTICICPSSSLLPHNLCQQCKSNLLGQNIQGCALCKTSTTCMNCTKGYVLTDGNCETCDRYIPGCIYCEDKNVCTQCNTTFGYILSEGQCVCSSSTYMINGVCKNCTQLVIGCKQCSSISTCTACNQLKHFQLNSSNQCACVSGYFLQNQRCVQCDSRKLGCAICNLTTCKQCKQGYVLTDNQTCECASGYTQILEGCIPCQTAFPNCQSCNATSCVSCNKFYEFNQTSHSCQVAEIIQSGCPNLACALCVNGVCMQCTSGAYMKSQNECVCKPGYFENNEYDCQKCDEHGLCVVCYHNQSCVECIHKSFLLWDCSCPAGKYIDYNLKRCIDCPLNCKTCSSATTCTDCNEIRNRQLVQGVCQCLDGFESPFPNNYLQDYSTCVQTSSPNNSSNPVGQTP